jgi:glycosyltransferase involved in cell wall biosynthesis
VKILQVSHYFASHGGGVEIIAAEMARRLVARGHEVSWAATLLRGQTAPPDVESVGMRGVNVTERWMGVPYPLWEPLSLGRLWRAVRRCDLVHIHDCLYSGNIAAWRAARWFGKPVVVTQHIGLVPYDSALLRQTMAAANALLGRLVLGGSDQVVFYSPQVRDYFSDFLRFRSPPALVANGVDTEAFSPASPAERTRLRRGLALADDRPLLLFVGRFVEKKGLRVLRPVCERMSDCQWLFVGWGPEDPAGWNLPHVKRIEHAARAQMADLYRAADLLVLPSRGEGFPLVVQEAMSSGTPVVITPETAAGCPGVESVAWTCPPDSRSWEAQLRELLADPERLADQRPLVREFAHAAWNWESAVDGYEAIYRRLTHAAESPAPIAELASTNSPRSLESLVAK